MVKLEKNNWFATYPWQEHHSNFDWVPRDIKFGDLKLRTMGLHIFYI